MNRNWWIYWLQRMKQAGAPGQGLPPVAPDPEPEPED